MPDEQISVEDLERMRDTLDAAPVPDPNGYAHIPMTDEQAERAKVLLAEEAEKHKREAEVAQRLKEPLKPYPIPLGAMLNSMYQRYSIDRRHKFQGKNAQAKLARAKAKRAKKHKTPFNP